MPGHVAALLTNLPGMRLAFLRIVARSAMLLLSKASAENRQTAAWDARSFALTLIDHFGERAVSYAAHQSLKANSRGDTRNAARWRWVAEVTRDVLRSDIE
jgi:hypothetical protein